MKKIITYLLVLVIIVGIVFGSSKLIQHKDNKLKLTHITVAEVAHKR